MTPPVPPPSPGRSAERSGEALVAAARAAAAAGDRAGALGLARAAMAAGADAPEPLFLLCRLLLEQGDPEAGALLARLERFPAYASGWQELGETLLRARQPAAALVGFERALGAEPGMLAALLGRAAALAALGRGGEAVETLRAAEALAPRAAEIPYRQGLLLRQAGDAAGARQALARAVALDSGRAEAWFSLGLACEDQDDAPAAVAAYAAALRAKADFHEAALNLGIARQECGDFESALDAYATALRLRPESYGRIAQAVVSRRTGRLWLDPEGLRKILAARSAASGGPADHGSASRAVAPGRGARNSRR
jgi:tetratricopeptide (TPR) repeat protein